jgi:hypothetical protein
MVTLALGIIGVIVTSFTLIVGKENKTSEFRQKWIDDQRGHLSAAISAALAYVQCTDPAEKLKLLPAFDKAYAEVELGENPIKTEWEPVLTRLKKISKGLRDGSMTEADIFRERKAMVEHAQKEFKRNWTMVKNGEAFFNVFKWFFVLFLLLTSVSLIALNWHSVVDHNPRVRTSSVSPGSVRQGPAPRNLGAVVDQNARKALPSPAPS